MTVPATRVLIADDSPTLRRALRTLLSADPRLQVVGEAGDGEEAVALAKKLRPDLITIDVLMPRIDGLRATEKIMTEAPTRIVVVSQLAATQEDLAVRALAAGALALIAKPQVQGAADLERWGAQVRETVRLMSEVPVVTRHAAHVDVPPPARWERPSRAGPLRAFGLVASTGGPQVLAEILSGLPRGLPIPLLVAQHIAAGFGQGLVRWFGDVSQLAVGVAVHGARALAGHVYLAPDGCDLELGDGGVLLARAPSSDHRPSGDALLASMARSLGPRAGGIVLSGMGEDGARGLLALRRAGGLTFAQDEASCVVWGMPKAAVQLQAAEFTVAPADLGRALVAACAGGFEG
ncbi:MAG TPA: chemotaxis protein CheB [Myxococcales bacterium]